MASGAIGRVAYVDRCRLAARNRSGPKAAIPGEDQRLAVAAPVGSLDFFFAGLDHVSHARLVVDSDGLERAVKCHGRRVLRSGEGRALNIGERSLLPCAVPVRADSKPGIKRLGKMQLDRGAVLVER